MEAKKLTVGRVIVFFVVLIAAGLVVGVAMGLGGVIVDKIFGKSNDSWPAEISRAFANFIVVLMVLGVYRWWTSRRPEK